MLFMIAFKETNTEVARRDNPAAAPSYWGAWGAYMGAMQESGIMVSGNALQPPRTATHVRVEDGKRQVQDGPFVETHEHLGGYVIVNTANLDEALEWASRAPCAAAGSVEVRPVLPAPTEASA